MSIHIGHRHVSPLQTPPLHPTATVWVPAVIHTAKRLQFDLKLVLAALSLASHAHSAQVRSADGAPFIAHPVAVAQAYAQHPNSHQSGFVAALLHDVLEDAPEYTAAVHAMFGTEVVRVIEAMTKDMELTRHHRALDVHDRLLAHITLTGDHTAGLVKLADRVHNIFTSAHLPVFKRNRLEQEAKQWFAPLAQQLGCQGLAEWLAQPLRWSARNEDYLSFMHICFVGGRLTI